MGNRIEKWIMDILKCSIAVVLAATAFYVVCPKYYFSDISVSNTESGFALGAVRCNRITGEVVLVITNRQIVMRENALWGNAPVVSEKHGSFIPDKP